MIRLRSFCISRVAACVLTSQAILSAQGTCVPVGSPDRYGDVNFHGQYGYVFDYWSDAAEHNGTHRFQLGVKNEGKTPLTINWLTADFFRRGIAPSAEALSECREDRNPLNVKRGIIKYGPLTQYDGPDARFYQSQPTTASAQTHATDFSVVWKAILDSDKPYLVSFKAQATLTAERGIEYAFSNFEDPIEIEWTQVLTQPVLLAAQQINQPSTVRNGRLILGRGQALRFSFSGTGIRSQAAPLSVYIPSGPLLYRDVFTGLTFAEVRR
jgi:hypothetical protein